MFGKLEKKKDKKFDNYDVVVKTDFEKSRCTV